MTFRHVILKIILLTKTLRSRARTTAFWTEHVRIKRINLGGLQINKRFGPAAVDSRLRGMAAQMLPPPGGWRYHPPPPPGERITIIDVTEKMGSFLILF